MSAYPRANRAALRAAVRELTAIHSTDIVSDARINDLLNARLYKIHQSADNLFLYWQNAGNRIEVYRSDTNKTYRFPGWQYDNTTQFPGTPNPISADLYMESDSDTPPWQNGSYDASIAYGAAADILRFINDDSSRVATYEEKFTELANNVIRDEYVNHNMMLAEGGLYNTTIPGFQYLSLAVRALGLIREVISIDANLDIGSIVDDELDSELNILASAFAWPGPGNPYTLSYYSPHVDIFAYAVAAKTAKRLGLEQSKIESLQEQYNIRKDALLRIKLYSNSGVLNSQTIGNGASQVRALLQDFSKDLPETLIYSWLNIAYQSLILERAWPWQEATANIALPAGLAVLDLTNVAMGNRILNAYEVRYNGAGEVIDSEIVYPVPHILDGKVGDAKYTYDVQGGFFLVSPTPTETTYFRLRYILDIPPITGPNSPIYFDPKFADILAYRAAVIGSSWSDYGKKMRDVFQDTADKIFDAMVSYYLLDHSTEPMQLGGSALETKKYLPWFRTP